MSKKIKKLIKRHRNALKYSVESISSPEISTLEIKTNHSKKTHKIYIPMQDVRPVEILHELGHAHLSETVHPLFSTATLLDIPSDEVLNSVLAPAIRAADDWFVDAWLIGVAPDEEKAEIESHYKMVTRQEKGSRLELSVFTGSALIIAQAEKYLGIKTPMTGDIERAVKAFTSVNPDKPTVGKLQTVINGLLLIYSEYYVTEKDNCWQVHTK